SVDPTERNRTIMKRVRLSALAAFALGPAAVCLCEATQATASTYTDCVAKQNANAKDLCDELKRDNPKTQCSTVASPDQIKRMCGVAPTCTSVTGALRPKFIVVSVIYAPPGSANSTGASTVDYGTASTTGTTTSVKDSFKSSYSLTVSAQ